MIEQRIREIVPSIDAIRFWFSSLLNQEELRELERLNQPHPVVGNAERMRGPGNTKWCYTLKMTCPTPAALNWLKERFGSGQYRINYIEVASDYVCDTMKDAELVADYFDLHLIKPRNQHEKTKVGKTTYIGKRKSASTLAGYVRHSKITGEPCYHLEFRLKGTPLARLNLNTFGELQAIDIRGIFANRLRLVDFDRSQLARMGREALGPQQPRYVTYKGLKHPIDWHRRMGANLARLARNDKHDAVDCQRLKELLRDWKVEDTNMAFKRLDNTPFLP